MNRIEKLVVTSCLVAILGFLYYLFFVPYEYQVSFKVKTQPGDVIETIRIWSKSLSGSEIVAVDSIRGLIQILERNGIKYLYTWDLAYQDSITSGLIKISQPGREKFNKILVPFSTQQIESDAEAISLLFYKMMQEHLNITKVRLMGEVDMDTAFCFCKRVNTTQTDKAKAMMYEYPFVNSVFEAINLKITGAPSLHVVEWSHSKNRLIYDFCFPVSSVDTLTQVESFQYKSFKKTKALKAVYNGNYITSDRAWYELIHYAQTHGYKIVGGPIEYFMDNPNYGSSEVDWRAEIYLPISK